MSANEGTPDGKRWVMPVLLESFGLAAAFKTFDAFDAGKPWKIYFGYAVLGVVLMIGGVLWAVFRKRVAEISPWNKLRGKEAQLAQALLVNSELRAKSGLDKSSHNVQCVGFKAISDPPFTTATLIFRNVPNGQLLGKFQFPRLRVIYYDHSTGLEIADLCPLLWWGQYEDAPSEIGASETYAQVALFFEGKWKAYELNEPRENDFHPKHGTNSIELPAGELRIVAMLSGEYRNLSIPQVRGVLTLKEDGSASFQHTND